MTTKIIQECGCAINVYSDGSAGGAEVGEWCDLHGAASDLLKSLEEALRWIGKLDDWSGVDDPDMEKWRAVRDKAKGAVK